MELLNQQMSTARLILNFEANTKKMGREKLSDPTTLEIRLELLEDYWKTFLTRHPLLEADAAMIEQDYIKKNNFETVQDLYLSSKVFLRTALKKTEPEPARRESIASTTVASLPKLALPTFSGNLLEWENFRDMFKAMVHDETALPAIMKLHYLKAHLTGEAAQLLGNISISGASYAGAWTSLTVRYDNSRVLISTHLRNLIALTRASRESAPELKRLLDTFCEGRRALQNLKRPVEQQDEWFVHLLEQKLDPVTRKDWETSLDNSADLPKYDTLTSFLAGRIRALEFAHISEVTTKTTSGNNTNKSKKSGTVSCTAATSKPSKSKNTPTCLGCKGTHILAYCPHFRIKNPQQRLEQARELKLCLNCLRNNHLVKECPSEKRCLSCNGEHHTMLHEAQLGSSNKEVGQNTTTNNQTPTTSPQVSSHSATASKHMLLATAVVVLESNTGRSITVRALLDQGLEASFVSERVGRALRGPKVSVNVPVFGVGSTQAGISKHLVQLRLRSKTDADYSLDFEALMLPKLTSLLPGQKVTVSEAPHLKNLQLADPCFGDPAPIDLILGAEVYALILLDGIRRGPRGTPIAQRTRLGWILSGTSSEGTTAFPSSVLALHCTPEPMIELSNRLQEFWTLEDVRPLRHWTAEEEACEQHYEETHSRLEGKRYEVRLPQRDAAATPLGDSRRLAVTLFYQGERRRQKNPGVSDQYSKFMSQYLELGHMQPLDEQTTQVDASNVYYMPHHAVFKTHGPQKIRVVFNGSQRTTSGLSLNDRLLPGPKLQPDLWLIVLRWRTFPIAAMADMVKMFRQILVNPEDTHLQRIVWRDSPEQPLVDYCLKTVTYGTAPAPWLALRTIQQLAKDEEGRFPRAAAVLRANTYVDDILWGADDLASAQELKTELINLLAAGGFELSKWVASTPDLLETQSETPVEIQQDDTIRALGLIWEPSEDRFRFKVTIQEDQATTKREILSGIARLFDPLGWLTPIVITAKCLLQNLWMAGVDWDEPAPSELLNTWQTFQRSLRDIETIAIPRWVGTNSSRANMELHAFCDASERAYAAAVYIRVKQPGNNAQVTLLAAKSKVAPVKTVSVPRLELCGAGLLAKLLSSTQETLGLQMVEVHAWSDSQVVLAWLRGHPSKWKTFVGNRVSEIHSLLPNCSWHHVPTASNPADAASRGTTPLELRDSNLWWNGPAWLTLSQTHWPQNITGPLNTTQEARASSVTALPATTNQSWDLVDRYSNLSTLIRITALCFRFIKNSKTRPEQRAHQALSTEELRNAREFWIRQSQMEVFSTEISNLSRGQAVSKKSPLLKFNPFLDEKKILRIGGRLKNSHLSYGEKHPAILPKSSRISLLLARAAHAATMHGGPQLTLSYLMRDVWIISGRNLVRSVTRHCITCTRHKAKTENQLMGQLPQQRIEFSRPFTHTGVDYAGPISIRASKGRGQSSYKGYIALFVCLATKAVHIEAVSDYTSAAFLAAFSRFISRRGRCSNLYSDNGTTFQGADNELRALFRASSEYYLQLAPLLANDGTQWSFIPPYAPHMGGLWEAGVKAVKHHLRRTIGEAKLTFEELATVLTQIEACLNSRPISPLSTDPTDLAALTPGHFLIGCPPTLVPEPSTLEINSNRLSRWQLTRNMMEHFWQRWSREYLYHLQERSKWRQPSRNLKVGDIVLIKNELLPPTKWALARVEETHPGPDGFIRVVTLRTAQGTCRRPIAKVCLLPVAQEDRD